VIGGLCGSSSAKRGDVLALAANAEIVEVSIVGIDLRLRRLGRHRIDSPMPANFLTHRVAAHRVVGARRRVRGLIVRLVGELGLLEVGCECRSADCQRQGRSKDNSRDDVHGTVRQIAQDEFPAHAHLERYRITLNPRLSHRNGSITHSKIME